MLAARPFDRSLMTPINATDMQHCNPQQKLHILSSDVQLPSVFPVKCPCTKDQYKTQNKQHIEATNNNEVYTAEKYKCLLDIVSANSNVARSQSIEDNFCGNIESANDAILANKRDINNRIVNFPISKCLAKQEIVSIHEMHTSENSVSYGESASKNALEKHREALSDITRSIAIDSNAASIAEFILADAFLPPSAIHANDIIGSTLDEEKLSFVQNKLTDKYNATDNPALHATLESILPLNASNKLHVSFEDKIKKNSSSNKNMERTVKNLTDISMEKLETSNAINPLSETEKKIHKYPFQITESTITPAPYDQKPCIWLLKHKEMNNSSAMEVPNAILTASSTNSLSNNSNYANPAVSNLLDLQSSVNASPLQAMLNKTVLYPTVIHSKQLQNQKLPHIVENFNEQLTRNTQHIEYVKDAMKDLKIDLIKQHTCQKCHEDICVGDVAITAERANNVFWHPACFVCSVCNELLVDLVYFYYKNQLYCGRDLAAFLEIPRCFACDEVSMCKKVTFYIIYFLILHNSFIFSLQHACLLVQ